MFVLVVVEGVDGNLVTKMFIGERSKVKYRRVCPGGFRSDCVKQFLVRDPFRVQLTVV